MTDHWPLPAVRCTTTGTMAGRLQTSLRARIARKALVEDIRWMRECGESPQMAAVRVGKSLSALEKAMRVAKEPQLSGWFANATRASCEDCGIPIRAVVSMLCSKCASREAKAC